jgi:hypothetical protein
MVPLECAKAAIHHIAAGWVAIERQCVDHARNEAHAISSVRQALHPVCHVALLECLLARRNVCRDAITPCRFYNEDLRRIS